MRTMKKIVASVAVVSAVGLTAACGSSDDTADAASGTSTSRAPMAESTPMEEEPAATDPAANLVGPGCADYAAQVPDGAGSVEGMSADPVAVAAGNNPLLTTLTAAVSGQVNPKVDLVDTLNGDDFTVFAPVDAAFAELPKKTVDALAQPKNADLLSTVLTYHVVPGQLSPAEIADSTQTTVQGSDVEVTGSGDDLKVNDAHVICGGVQTANATVYLIDAVLMPPM